MAIANKMVGAVLRSPVHRLMDKSVLLLTYTGRRSGRSFTLPVQYVKERSTITVVPGHPDSKTWWRNFRNVPRPVQIRIDGLTLGGKALACEGGPELSRGIEAYSRRFPKVAAKTRIPVVVRIELDA